MRRLLLGCALGLAACSPVASAPASTAALQAYATATRAVLETPRVVFADTPLPSATPVDHVIREGDTLSELAQEFNVSQDDLMAANPGLDPRNLTIGATIRIPSRSSAQAAEAAPEPLPIPQAVCHPAPQGGLWCFALVRNDTPDRVENVSVRISLIDSGGNLLAGETAFLPLDVLPAGASLPAYHFFPMAPAEYSLQVQLLSALQAGPGATRTLPAVLDETLAEVSRDRRIARLSGRVFLPMESPAAARVWVAAVAYDRDGRVVGVRRWEGGALQPGTVLPFGFTIGGLGSGIDRVDFVVQALP